MPVGPDHGSPNVEEVLQIRHSSHTVEDESKKMRKGSMRDTVGSPWAMVIHFGNASQDHSARPIRYVSRQIGTYLPQILQ